MRISISIGVLIIQCCIVAIHATTKSVSLYSREVRQLVTSNTLVWQSFSGDQKLLEFAVEAAKFKSEHEDYPIYVCRATVDGIAVTGHTQKRDSRIVCIVSMHTTHTHHVFDVLLNKGNGGKLSWKPWSKYTAVIPTGAVSASSDGHVCISI